MTPAPMNPHQIETLNEVVDLLAKDFPAFFIALIYAEDGSLAGATYPPDSNVWDDVTNVITEKSPYIGGALRHTWDNSPL